MQELRGDIFRIAENMVKKGMPLLAILFTANRQCKANGSLVMGAGIAKEFRDRFPGLDKECGKKMPGPYCNLVQNFNLSYWLGFFCTKDHWKNPSTLEIIERSCIDLKGIMEAFPEKYVLMTRPGCGLGGLNWETEVKPLLLKYFNDTKYLVIVTR